VKALLEGAAELIKNEKSIILFYLSNQEKTILIDVLRNRFNLKELLQQLQLSKSSYFYKRQILEKPDKYFKELQNKLSRFSTVTSALTVTAEFAKLKKIWLKYFQKKSHIS